MKLIRHLDQIPSAWRSGAVTIGNYDGVHLGHARIAKRLVAQARNVGGSAIVFTFDPPPANVLRPDNSPAPLTWVERKLQLLAELGVDGVIAYPTDEAFLHLEPREFFDRIVRHALDARAMVEGPNFFFGHHRRGNIERLDEYCHESGVALEVVEPVQYHGKIVSSSRVRAMLAAGQVDHARQMLTQPYRIRGTVIHGAGRGASLGYPTANVEGVDTLLPGEGIYAGRAMVDDRAWPAAISVGPNPTFDEGQLKVEVYLIGFQGDLYDRRIEVEFLSRLRDVVRYDSVAALVAQLDRDVEATTEIVAAWNSPPVARPGVS